VDSTDVLRRTLTVGGIQVAVHPLAGLDKPGGECGAVLSLPEIVPGEVLTINGDAGAGGAALIAGNVSRPSASLPSPEMQMSGRLTAPTESGVLLDGLRVGFGPSTAYLNCSSPELTREEFLAVVRAELAKPGGTVFATAVGAPAPGTVALPTATNVSICLDTGLLQGTLRAQVDSIDAATRSIVLLGIPMGVSPGATIEDRSSGTATSVALDQVTAGQFVEVGVRWFRLFGTREVEQLAIVDRGGAGAPYLRIRPDEKRRPDVIALGWTVRTSADTVFTANGGAADADAFFACGLLDTEFEFARETDGSLRATKINYLYEDWSY
jgi:hypothetical protein